LRSRLFSIDIQTVEDQYKTKVERDSLPLSLRPDDYISPTIQLDTCTAIIEALDKKLGKTYSYQREGFSDKGTLILALFDPNFGTFTNDLEIQWNTLDLEYLKTITKCHAAKSSFRKILLVDALVPFEDNTDLHT
jgi:hypothetical protein